MIPICLQSGNVIRVDTKTWEWDLSSLTLQDLAIQLARTPRFTGGSRKRYSVAEHAFWGYKLTEEPWYLHHDDAEALGFGDVNGILKQFLFMEAYSAAEDTLLTAISEKFKVPRKDMKKFDKALGNVEAVKLHGHPDVVAIANYDESVKLLPYIPAFRCWDEARAAEEWLTEAYNAARAS